MVQRKQTHPSYLLHKPSGQARIRIDGRDIYLGKYGSPESRAAYDRLVNPDYSSMRVDRCRQRCGAVGGRRPRVQRAIGAHRPLSPMRSAGLSWGYGAGPAAAASHARRLTAV